MNAQGEHGRFERGNGDATLGDDAHEERDQRTVGRAHEVLGRDERRQVAGVTVVVERHNLHVVAGAQVGQVAEAIGVHRIDQDETSHALTLNVAGIDHGNEVGVESLKVAHIAVDRAAQAHRGLGIELMRGYHRRKGVEVGVGVGRDQLRRTHQ